MAWDSLREAVITMRALRGNKCYPLVNLTERSMKSKYRPGGMGMRPHFEIVGWKVPGVAALTPPATPQLTGPTTASMPTPTPTAATPATASSSAATVPSTQPRPAKPPVTLSADTLTTMGDVKPVTSKEFFDDEIPW
jgi:hypothetical protein